jgi:hypothetical protein
VTCNSDLSGCVNDVTNVRDSLFKFLGFKIDDIRVITDERATKNLLECARCHRQDTRNKFQGFALWMGCDGDDRNYSFCEMGDVGAQSSEERKERPHSGY